MGSDNLRFGAVMKRFEIPALFGDDRLSFKERDAAVYSWTAGRFIVNVFGHFIPEDRKYLGSRLSFSQIYVVGDQLQAVIREQPIIDGVKWDFYQAPIATDNNSNFYIEGIVRSSYPNLCMLFSIPDLKRAVIRYANGEPVGTGKELRFGNNAIISGNNPTDTAKMFLGDVKIKEDDVAVIHFHAETAYTVKVMNFAGRESGKVVSLAISLDKLTACALISYPFGSWEVVVFDLEQ